MERKTFIKNLLLGLAVLSVPVTAFNKGIKTWQRKRSKGKDEIAEQDKTHMYRLFFEKEVTDEKADEILLKLKNKKTEKERVLRLQNKPNK